MPAKNSLTVSGHFANLGKIGNFVTRAAARAGLDERAVYAVQMAVDEACTNVIEHAYGGEGNGSIRLTYDIRVDGLQITIYDQGKSFDPNAVPKLNIHAPLEERARGGMGLFFIHRLVDRVEYRFKPEGNELILFKRREPTP